MPITTKSTVKRINSKRISAAMSEVILKVTHTSKSPFNPHNTHSRCIWLLLSKEFLSKCFCAVCVSNASPEFQGWATVSAGQERSAQMALI